MSIFDGLDELYVSLRNRLPVILAAEAAECGLACLTMIARYHGHNVDLNGMRQRYPISISGATLRSLMMLADCLGLAARPLRLELDALRQLELPAIIHWNLNHFVVLKAVHKSSITIHDPAAGVRTLPFAEVSKHFTGVALELSRAETFKPVAARSPVGLHSLWTSMRGSLPTLGQVFILSFALQVAAFAAPFQIQLVVDEAVFRSDRDLLTVLAVGFGALIIIQALIETLRSWALRIMGQLLTFQILGNLVRHLLRLPADFFEKRHVGDILSRLGSVQPIQDALTRGLIAAIIDGTMVITAASILFVYSGELAAVVIGFVALEVVVAFAFYPAIKMRAEEEIFAKAKEQSHLMETVRASITVKLMGREAERVGAWRNLYADVTNASISVAKFQITQSLAQSIISGLMTVLVTFLAARMIIDGSGFSVGMLYAFLSFRQTFTDRSAALINQSIQFMLLRLHLDRLADLITATPDANFSHIPKVEVNGRIKLCDVSFRYGTSDPFVLANSDLDISPGDFVALTGPSGSGKSTLMKILLGLYAPTEGQVELDGQRATPEYWRAWRSQVGIVAQDDRLLSGTIADNIAFFDPDFDMERVQQAAKDAQVHSDISRMPMQYLSLVGDMGSSLSGGQRQRVLLARALYRRPKVLFLDEGTANLDEKTEEIIADLIDDMPITRIVVAHRPALIKRATKVFEVSGRNIALVESRPKHKKRSKLAVVSDARDVQLDVRVRTTRKPRSKIAAC